MTKTTKNKEKRSEFDFYPTPEWCIEAIDKALLSKQDFGNKWLEPACGNGAIVNYVKKAYPKVLLSGVDMDPAHYTVMKNTLGIRYTEADYLSHKPLWHNDLIITNPPYNKAMEFVQKAVTEATVVVMLLRLGFVASQKRSEFMKTYTPDVYVLSKRPSFKNGGNDNSDYAWFVFKGKRNQGIVTVL